MEVDSRNFRRLFNPPFRSTPPPCQGRCASQRSCPTARSCSAPTTGHTNASGMRKAHTGRNKNNERDFLLSHFQVEVTGRMTSLRDPGPTAKHGRRKNGVAQVGLETFSAKGRGVIYQHGAHIFEMSSKGVGRNSFAFCTASAAVASARSSSPISMYTAFQG